MSNEQNLNSGNLQDKVSSNILLNELPIGIILLDAELNTSFINNAVDSFDLSRHKSLSKHTGKNLIELLPNLLSKNDLNKLKKNESLEKQVSIETDEEGNEQIIWLRIIPLFDSGKENGFVLIIDKQKITNEILFERFPKFQPVISLVSKLSDAILITDTDGNILLMQTKESFTNVPFNSKKKNIFDAFKQVDLGELFSEVKSQNSVKIIRFEQQIARENISYKLKFVPVQDTEEKVRLIFILIDDETEEINNQRELSQKLIDAELQNEIISSIEHAIIRTDWEGGISYFNNAANNLFFITSDEKKKFIGRTVPIINKTFFNSIKEELTENNVWEGDLKYTRDNEDFKAISVRASQIEVNNEKSILFLFSDISHRAEMERELRMSEERYRLMVTNAREYICLLDPDGTIKYANPFFVENFDLSLEENFETNFRDLIDDSSLEASMKNFSVFLKLLKDEKELILNKNNGDKIFVIARFTPVLDFNGDVKNYNGILIDVTEKKDTEKNLLLIRSVFEASRDGVAVFKSRELILANDSFIEMFGYQSYDELSGKDPLYFVDDKDKEQVLKSLDEHEKDPENEDRIEFKGRRVDGSTRHIEISVSSYDDEDENYLVCLYRDISEAKKSEDALKISEERYRNIAENISEFIWSAERDNGSLKPVLYTESVKRITGYYGDQFISDRKLWFKIIHPSDAGFVVKKLNRFYKDKTRSQEELEYRILNKVKSIVWIKNKVNVTRSSDGKVIRIYGLVSDITANKRAEEEIKKNAADLRSLNETKDRFLSIISHDLRTPFSSILGFTDLLLGDRQMPEEKQEQYISFIQESAQSMLALVNSLLDWTRLQTGRIEFEPQRLNAKIVITNAIQMLSGTAMQKNINLVNELEDSAYVHADENLLLQVFSNLMSNAIKFTKSGGSITIAAKPLPKDRQIQFSVTDSGVGIREEDKKKLFRIDTKFTSLGTAGEKGSGLGLSLVHDIVKKHGGDIRVESELGRGTSFIFTIPVSSTKILLVDDRKTDRLLYSKLLKSIAPKYDVIEAKNGEEALAIIKSATPALVISDHVMPVMNGYEMVKQILYSDIKYKPPIIILSADITEGIKREYNELGIDFVFSKPVNLNIFKFAIEKSLKKTIISG